MQRLNVLSFWVRRPVEYPHAPDYVPLLRLLQQSCDRLGLRHVVMTDATTAEGWPDGLEAYREDLPPRLMQAATEAHARWSAGGDWQGCDTLFVGADCLIVRHPDEEFPKVPALAVTLRIGTKKYPINTGAMMLRQHGRREAAALYRTVADRCGPTWCDDQRAIRDALAPMPGAWGTVRRAGMKVAFLPMRTFNFGPSSIDDAPGKAVVAHFRQKRKEFMPAWAARYLGL